MQIKRITAAEYSLVTALFNSYRIFYKQSPDLALAEAFIQERLNNNESVIFVALAGDELHPVGFTQLYPLISSVRAVRNWLLNDLYVDGDYRKQGIGEALIKSAMDFSRSNGAACLKLETAIDNYTAQSLYESIGFVKQVPASEFFSYQFTL